MGQAPFCPPRPLLSGDDRQDVPLPRPRRATPRVAGRSAAVVPHLFGFVVNGLVRALLLDGIGHGPHDLATRAFDPRLAVRDRHGDRRDVDRPALPQPICRDGPLGLHRARGSWKSVASSRWRLVGAVGVQCLDIAALSAACLATGHPLGVLALWVAYFMAPWQSSCRCPPASESSTPWPTRWCCRGCRWPRWSVPSVCHAISI